MAPADWGARPIPIRAGMPSILLRVVFCMLLAVSGAARADTIEVRSAELRVDEGEVLLNAEFDFAVNSTLETNPPMPSDENTAQPVAADPTTDSSRPGHPGVGYVPEIDGLRAVAVLSVMAYHANPNWIPDQYYHLGLDITPAGQITVTNSRNNFSKTYKARAAQ